MRRRLMVMGMLAPAALAACATSRANVTLPSIISDNMVVQAGKPLPIWGLADAGEQVTVTLGKQTQTATADADGKWMVKFEAVPAGEVGSMTVSAANTLTVSNILAGSVWLCAGQASMAMPLEQAHNAATDVPKETDPKMRLFKLEPRPAMEAQFDTGGKWVECTPPAARYFSAVGYFFGRELRQMTDQPVGLIQAAVGGTPAQAWVSLDTLDHEPTLKTTHGDAYRKFAQSIAPQMDRFRGEIQPKFEADLKRWEEAARQARAAGQPLPKAPERPVPPDQVHTTPTVLYNGMIAPLMPFTIEGVIWYQGETNVGPADYRLIFPRLINDWRLKWGQGDFPFIFAQLPNNGPRRPEPVSGGMAMIREAQATGLKRPNTGMAVTIDIGQVETLVPKDKIDVAHRMFLWAQKLVYGKDVVCSGPLYATARSEGNRMRVTFTEVGGGLVIGSAPSLQVGVPPAAPLSELKGFALAGPDQKWQAATAKIDANNTVVVSSPQVPRPVAVRYAWADNPECNLYNKEGLPAAPFRSDTWPK